MTFPNVERPYHGATSEHRSRGTHWRILPALPGMDGLIGSRRVLSYKSRGCQVPPVITTNPQCLRRKPCLPSPSVDPYQGAEWIPSYAHLSDAVSSFPLPLLNGRRVSQFAAVSLATPVGTMRSSLRLDGFGLPSLRRVHTRRRDMSKARKSASPAPGVSPNLAPVDPLALRANRTMGPQTGRFADSVIFGR